MAIVMTMHSVYTRTMNAQYVLLSFLANESNYGYELKKSTIATLAKISPYYPGKSIRH